MFRFLGEGKAQGSEKVNVMRSGFRYERSKEVNLQVHVNSI
jgi:hypothetical protein